MRVVLWVTASIAIITVSACSANVRPARWWVQDTQTGCAVYDPFPVPNESVIWSGDCLNGKAEGSGVATWSIDGRFKGRGEGNFVAGHLGGQVTLTSASGATYVGDGGKYVGEIRDDKKDGQGSQIWPDGRKYVGHWKDDKQNGQGTLYAASGSILESGPWSNGVSIGAVATLPNIPPVSVGKNEISLIKQGGTFKVPVLINGIIPLQFNVDSGAADVSIPADVVMTLMRTGTITNADFLGDQTYILADGSKVKSKTFRIRQLKVGDRVVENVLGGIANVNGGLLLGQSFLGRFKSVKFDYDRGVLVLE